MNEITHQERLLELLNQAQAALDEIFFQMDEDQTVCSEQAIHNMRNIVGQANIIKRGLASSMEVN